MYKFILVFLCFFISISNSSYAQFGSMFGAASSLIGGGASGGDTDTLVKQFITNSQAIEKLMGVSLLTISAAYASDSDREKLISSAKALQANTDPKEVSSIVAEVQKTQGAKIQELAKASDAEERTKKLSAEKQKQVIGATTNFLIAALKSAALTANAKNIMASVKSNPMNVMKVAPVSDALPVLLSAATISTEVIPGFVKVLIGADLKVETPTASSTEIEISL